MTGWWFDCAYTMIGIWKMTMLMNTKLMWNMINHITLNIQKKWKYLNYFQWNSKEVILLFIRSHNKIEFIKHKSFIYYCIKKMQPEWLNISLQIWLMIIVCIGAVSNRSLPRFLFGFVYRDACIKVIYMFKYKQFMCFNIKTIQRLFCTFLVVTQTDVTKW